MNPLCPAILICRWLACRLVTLDSYRNRKCRWWDVWVEPTVLFPFRGPSRCKYDVLYVYGGGINRCASMSPAHPPCWCCPVGLAYLETNPIVCINLRYGMRCWNVDDDCNPVIAGEDAPRRTESFGPLLYIAPILFWMYRELIGSTSDCN